MAKACIPLARIAEIVRISEPTLLKHYFDEVDGARQRLLAKAVKTMSFLLDENNLGAAIYVLKSQGKAYGWTERHEVTGKDGDPLLPKFEGLTDAQLKTLADAERILAALAPPTTGHDGAGAPGARAGTQEGPPKRQLH